MIKRGDLILILSLVIVDAIAFVHIYSTEPGAYAHVYSLGQEPTRVDLRQQGRIQVAGALGPSVLEMNDGKIRFLSSPCRRKLCVQNGWTGQAGAGVACLPNRVAIKVAAAARTFDSLNY